MSHSPRDAPPPSPPRLPNPETSKPASFPSLSEHDIQKMKYKIDLDKQVAEKKQRTAQEWETKLERDKKYANQQAVFGRRDDPGPIRKQDLQQIFTQSHAPSPLVLNKPEHLSLHFQQLKASQENNAPNSFQPPAYTGKHSATTNRPASPRNDFFQSSFSTHHSQSASYLSPSASTAQPVKGDAHDPFISFDPNKEHQQVFNIIPQQNLYEPWGRPGAGAPLVHQETGQKFTRYAGSLEDKLNTVGPLSFYRNQYSGNIHDQKRDIEVEQSRRQQEKVERRVNPGDTAADWISQIEGSHYPLKFHKPTTKTTRHYTGTHDPYTAEETRTIFNDLSRQTEERARQQQLARQENALADLCHTEAQNNWWSRDGAGGSRSKPRRFGAYNPMANAHNQQQLNPIGQPTTTISKPSYSLRPYDARFAPSNRTFVSKHTNFYQLSDTNHT